MTRTGSALALMAMAAALAAAPPPAGLAREGAGGTGELRIVSPSPGERVQGLVTVRAELGAHARETVEELYSTPVVARRYGDFLLEVA